MEDTCRLCDGSGLLVTERPDRSHVARECECRIARRQQRLLKAACIPPLYAASSFENYETEDRDKDGIYTLNHALYTAEKFVREYPLSTQGVGMLLTGSIGTGKTHLAVSVLKALILGRGATGVFCHFHDLIKRIQNSYNREVRTTELEVLDPILKAEVLVLDELGASKPSDWVFDTVAHILNTRYNEQRTTIITTNYVNREPTGIGDRPVNLLENTRNMRREESLGDRIGERMRSRLQEMCLHVEMIGPDHRRTMKRARLG